MKQIFRRRAFLAIVVLSITSNAFADEVTDWNRTMLRAGLLANSSPTVMTRVAAMVHAAIFDAVNGVHRRYTPVHVAPAAPSGASARAAAVQAAYVILTRLYGSGAPTPNALQQTYLDTRRTASLLVIMEREGAAAVNSGLSWGQTVADGITALRSGDPAQGSFPDSFIPGKWRRTLNLPGPGTALASAGYLQFSAMTPWSTSLGDLIDDFRPDAPPALTSATYTRDFNEVKMMGSFASPHRTADQTIYAMFWNYATVSYLWNNVALSLVESRNRDDDDDKDGRGWGHGRRNGLLENARLFGELNIAISDAIIGCWDSKYEYAYWRPVTAIHLAGDDGNPATTADTSWSPLFSTPAHPEYPSGHSCGSGAAGFVLAKEFGERTHFSVESDTLLGEVRSFRSFSAALEEVKNARIFAGIHFRTATEVGQQLGRSIAQFVRNNMFQRID